MSEYKVAYVCDKKACGKECPSEVFGNGEALCSHTLDISHAKNFEHLSINDGVDYYIESLNKEN